MGQSLCQEPKFLQDYVTAYPEPGRYYREMQRFSNYKFQSSTSFN